LASSSVLASALELAENSERPFDDRPRAMSDVSMEAMAVTLRAVR
jgi:hypothetical protein